MTTPFPKHGLEVSRTGTATAGEGWSIICGGQARERWLGHMLAAIDVVGIAEPARAVMREYFERASLAMINVYSHGKE